MCAHPHRPRLRCGLCEYQASLTELLANAAAQRHDFHQASVLFDRLRQTQGLRAAHLTLSILAGRNSDEARRRFPWRPRRNT